MTVPVEPIYIGGQSVFVKLFALMRNPGDPSRIEGTLTLIPGEGTLTLDALVGPKGNPGEAAPVMRPQFGSPITEAVDLPNPATLERLHNGRAWYIHGKWHVWYEGDYHIIEGSIPGPPGVTPDISVSAEQFQPPDGVPAFGPIEVIETGPSTAPNFHVKIPAVAGPEGPAAAIGVASDFDNSNFAVGKYLAAVSEDPDTYGLISAPVLYPRYWTIPQGNFIAHNGSEGRFLIASLSLPALDHDWYPDVLGHVQLKRALLSTAQTEIEVRIGDTGIGTGETDPLCGLAPYDPASALFDEVTICHILPHFSDVGNPIRSISPDTAVGRVLAGQAKTIYVFVHKAGGSGGYIVQTTNAHLRIAANPVWNG